MGADGTVGTKPRYSTPDEVAQWYAEKTPQLVQRYGPGPRIHYHTGWVSEPWPTGADASVLRHHVRSAQARLLEVAADHWKAASVLQGKVLDVGCGLGGGALHWAEQYGAHVTALTNVALHARMVGAFAREVGVQRQVKAVVTDACALEPSHRFDAAIAIESSCYLPRLPWFAQLARVLRVGGMVLVADIFLGDREARDPFDRDWRTRIGTLADYDQAASQAGFARSSVTDISAQTQAFWELTQDYLRAQTGDVDQGRRHPSSVRHDRLRRGWQSGGLRHLLVAWRLLGPRAGIHRR